MKCPHCGETLASVLCPECGGETLEGSPYCCRCGKPTRWKRWRPISPNVSPVVMETALVRSMKRESVMSVEIRILERRFDKTLLPFFCGRVKLGILFVCYSDVILLGLTA